MGLISLRCPSCNGDIKLDNANEFGYCLYCGNKVVLIDSLSSNKEERNSDNFSELGMNAFTDGNYKVAEGYFFRVLEIKPNDYNAIFYLGLSAGYQSTLAKPRLTEAINGARRALHHFTNNDLQNKQQLIGCVFVSQLLLLEESFFSLAMKHYNEFKHLQSATDDLWTHLLYLNDGLVEMEELLPNDFSNRTVIETYISLYETHVSCIVEINKWRTYKNINDCTVDYRINESTRNEMNLLYDKRVEFIKNYNSDYIPVAIHRTDKKNDNKNKEGCYIATAIYGSYNAKEVMILRNFRDNELSKNIIGRLFIKIYYKVSPTLSKKLYKTNVVTILIRKILDKIVEKINIEH